MVNKEYEEKEILRTKQAIKEAVSKLTEKLDKETIEALEKLICANVELYNSYRRKSSVF
jgi:hypothetical protein